jgi:hypothetical protein
MLGIALLELSACVGSPEGDESEPVESIQQAIGEQSCPDDYTVSLTVADSVQSAPQETSPNAFYGDKGCTNAFTGLVYFLPSSKRSMTLKAEYAGPVLQNNSPFPCDAEWVRFVVWHWEGRWVKLSDRTTTGSPLPGSSTCNTPTLDFIGPKQVGNSEYYAISAQSGVLSSYQRVTIGAHH